MTLRRALGTLLVDIGLVLCAIGVVVYGEWGAVVADGAKSVKEREERRWN